MLRLLTIISDVSDNDKCSGYHYVDYDVAHATGSPHIICARFWYICGVFGTISPAQRVEAFLGTQNHVILRGAQCKRTTVGVALVTRPRVLFLDEPTTGLDSLTAVQVVPCLRIALGSVSLFLWSRFGYHTTYI